MKIIKLTTIVILLALLILSNCKKKEKPTEPEPTTTTTGNTSSQKKTYCIYTMEFPNKRKNLQCGEMTSDEAQIIINSRNKQVEASTEVKTSCAACPL